MSQDSGFPFAQTDEGFAYADEPERNRKAMLVAGGVAAALAVAAGGYFLLGGSSEDTSAFAAIPHGKVRAAASVPTARGSAKKLPAPYKERIGRDPFKALYVVPVAAPVAAPATVGTAPTTTNSTAGTTTPTSTGNTGATGTTAGTGTAPTTTRYTLKLVSISKPNPEVRFTTWKVGSDSKTVIPAQRFGKYGEIVVLAFSKNAKGEVDKAIIQVGDDSPMDVAVGESVSVL